MELLVDRKLSQMANMERVTQVMTLVLSLFPCCQRCSQLHLLKLTSQLWIAKGRFGQRRAVQTQKPGLLGGSRDILDGGMGLYFAF